MAIVIDGRILVTMLPVGEIPQIDFATLSRAPTPNDFLLCPEGNCAARADGPGRVFLLPGAQLGDALIAAVAREPQVTVAESDPQCGNYIFVQRTRWLRFPDLIYVRVIALDERRSTIAIYSRSIYGRGDLGANRRRVTRWMETLFKATSGPGK